MDDLWTSEDKLLHLGENIIEDVHKIEEGNYGLEREYSDEDSDFEDEIDEVVRPGSMRTTTITANNVTLPSQPAIYTSSI